MANQHRQSFSFQTNCQVENKRCYFFTHSPHNSLHPKVNIHTWQLRQRWRWGVSGAKHCSVGWAWSTNWQWLREAPSLHAANAADSSLRRDAKRPQLRNQRSPTARRFSDINRMPTGAGASNNARRFVRGLLMSWGPALKCSFSITWGDFRCWELLPDVIVRPIWMWMKRVASQTDTHFEQSCADEDTLWHKLPGQCTTIWPTRCI